MAETLIAFFSTVTMVATVATFAGVVAVAVSMARNGRR